MAASAEYLELLRDPRWQRKRLEVMQRDDFKCRICGDGTKTLNVHHRYYEVGRRPWEYEGDALRTLCEGCHQQCTWHARDIKAVMKRLEEPIRRVVMSCLLFLEDNQEKDRFKFPAVTIFRGADGFFDVEHEPKIADESGAVAVDVK